MKKSLKSSKTPDYIEPRSIMDDYQKFTAHEARTRYKPPYNIRGILEHIERVCSYSQEIFGYERERFPDSLFAELQELGYGTEVYFDFERKSQCVKIFWGLS